jgi:hypothetical protein
VESLCRIAVRLLFLAYLLALGLFLVGTFGWFGSPKGPLAGVFLIPLGLPWNLLSSRAPAALLPWIGAGAPLVNIAILSALCSRLRS